MDFEWISGVPEMDSAEKVSDEVPTVAACPLLPAVEGRLGPEVTRGTIVKDYRYYESCLRYAQSLWRQGKPAQAILQLNKAFMADPGDDPGVVGVWPPPYAALVWILRHRPPGAFIGNPVRHFQHLATRVSGVRKEIRSWRAWACFHLSRRLLPEEEFPIDAVQIEKESLEIPEWDEVLDRIRSGGWQGEAEVLCQVAGGLRILRDQTGPDRGSGTVSSLPGPKKRM